MAFNKPKNFPNCYIYSLANAGNSTVEKNLMDFLLSGNRINMNSDAFRNIRDQIRSRAQKAVIFRMIQQNTISLVIANKELPASYKVIYAKDPKSKKKMVFIDVTGLINVKDGIFVCKDINKLAAYLSGAVVDQVYYTSTTSLTRDSLLQKASMSAFMRMFGSLLDYLRLTGYTANHDRILYIVGVYFGVNVIGIELNSARKLSASILHLSENDAKVNDYYYSAEEDFENIAVFANMLAKVFKLGGFNAEILLEKWMFMYGKGTLYMLELYPSFLKNIMYAATGGVYINQATRFEKCIGRDMVDIYNQVLTIGSNIYKNGFNYESAEIRDMVRRNELSDFIVVEAMNNQPTKQPQQNNQPQQNHPKPVQSQQQNNNNQKPTTPPTSDAPGAKPETVNVAAAKAAQQQAMKNQPQQKPTQPQQNNNQQNQNK